MSPIARRDFRKGRHGRSKCGPKRWQHISTFAALANCAGPSPMVRRLPPTRREAAEKG